MSQDATPTPEPFLLPHDACFVFSLENRTVGSLRITAEGRLDFAGDATESARLFFNEYLKPNFIDHICASQARLIKQQAALLKELADSNTVAGDWAKRCQSCGCFLVDDLAKQLRKCEGCCYKDQH